MLVAYYVTTALLSLLLVCVIIYESLFGRGVDDGFLKFRRRSFLVFFILYLAATIARFLSVSPRGVELCPLLALCLDVSTFIVFSILVSGYFGRWYYKNPYFWLLSLLMPALVYIFIVVMHFTDYYDPLYSYHELVVRFSSPDTRLVQIARITILTLLVFLCFFFIGVLYKAYQYDKKRARLRLTTLERRQNHREHRNVLIYTVMLMLTIVSDFVGSLAYDIFCNVAMMALLVCSAFVFSRFVTHTRMKQSGTFIPVVIEQELRRIESHSKDTPLFVGNPSLDDVAEELNVSRDELSDYIYQTRNMSFSKWVSFCKLKFVARLLETTDDSIADISASAGYKNLPSMYRAFKLAFDMTPTEYRSVKRNKS